MGTFVMVVFLQVGVNRVLLEFFLPEFLDCSDKLFRILMYPDYLFFAGTRTANLSLGMRGQGA